MSGFLNRMNYDDIPFNDNTNPYPVFFNFEQNINMGMIYASANFYRTESNSNIEIILDQGIDIAPNTIYRSSDVFLPLATFNSISPSTDIVFPDANKVNILDNLELLHDIRLQYKITKDDDTNFTNCRELRTTLVKNDNTEYHSSIFANNQPSTGEHDNIFIKTNITHSIDDCIKIRFQLVQDTLNEDISATKLTIFRICWMIMGIKEKS